jgi:NitT/TauT family transport system substrate-binding protein
MLRPFHVLIIGLLALVLTGAPACGGGDGDASAGAGTPGTESASLRLGYFPNVTHAQPNVALARGTFEEELGPNVELETKEFNSGTEVIEALFAGEIDASYIGPNPAINGFVTSGGEALRIVAGSASGGALLIVRPEAGIASPADFSGKKIASPSLGNTQDVALRSWLLANDLASQENGGDVQVIPTDNPDILTLFQNGDIDGAWVPEPWATRLVLEAGGEVFLDERELWPNGDFVTTHIIVETDYLADHPDVIEGLLRAHVLATQWIGENPEEAKQLTNQGIESVTGAALPAQVIDGTWPNLKFTYDPIASSLQKSADDAYALEFLEDEPDLTGIYDLTILNQVLAELQLEPVSDS